MSVCNSQTHMLLCSLECSTCMGLSRSNHFVRECAADHSSLDVCTWLLLSKLKGSCLDLDPDKLCWLSRVLRLADGQCWCMPASAS